MSDTIVREASTTAAFNGDGPFTALGERPPIDADTLKAGIPERVQALAFDPGKTTGYAYLDTHSIADQGQLTDANEVGGLIAELRPDVVIYESYPRNWARHNDFHWPLRTIGVIEYASHLVRRPVVSQTPAQAKCGFWTVMRRKELGLYTPGQPHANDAVLHLLHWFTFTHGDTYFKDLLEE